LQSTAATDPAGLRVLRVDSRPATQVPRRSLAGAYEILVLVYLASLLYVYPYGISLGAEASIRAPDLLGLLCLAAGAVAIAMQQRMRVDRLFLAIVGPFVLLEIATPVIGALGYRKIYDVVSSLRMAILWLPMVMLVLLAAPVAEPRFERRFRALLIVSLWLNIPYGLVQIAVDFGVLPAWMAFTRFLEPWAVATNFEVVLGLRPAGFFTNTTALSVFGVACLCYFYAQYVARREPVDLRYTLASLFVILMTTSRAAFATAALILAAGWFGLDGRRKLKLVAILLAGVAAILLVIEQTIGLQQAFYRFTRIVESGLLADVSLGQRIQHTWPAALAVARDYPFGTLISAPRIAALIDSGYLNFYMQGKWVFIASVVVMIGGMLAVGLHCLGRPRPAAGGLMILFLSLFLVFAMVTSNPVRTPIVIAFLVFAFWKLKTERDSRRVRATTHPIGAP
jgi:hypothetical protein